MTLLTATLLAALLAAVLSATVGTAITVRRRVIAAGGIAHASLGGVGLGAVAGFDPLLGAALVAVAAAFLLEWLQRRGHVQQDTAVSMVWTAGMAAGILLAAMAPGFTADLPSYLFGNILAVSAPTLAMMALLTAAVCILFGMAGRTWLAVWIDADFAATQGLPVRWLDLMLSVITALAVVALTKMVGIVLVVALLSLPQAIALLLAHTLWRTMWLSGLAALTACACGLALSFTAGLPAGAAIVLTLAALYAMAWAIKHLRARL